MAAVAITGSHGLIGSALAPRLESAGHRVMRVVRGEAGPGEISWDPSAGRLDPGDLAGLDAVVNLAGAGIGDRRWNDARKQVLLDSRVRATELLSRALAGCDRPPPVMLSASAVGYYGDRGGEPVMEDSPPGSGFLADLCRQWEAATAAAGDAGIRVVHLRTGIVLAPGGGALGKQLPLFKLGLGGRLGSGDQYTSWISLEDHVGALELALRSPALRGPVNVVAPNPVTNAAFTSALGRAVHRPAVLRVPGPALRLVFGREMAGEMLLSGQCAVPRALEAAGHVFAHPVIDDALRWVLR
jgi:uncharacterized protein